MLPHHAVHYHEAQDWICIQNQHELTYQSLLFHLKLFKSRCKQYQEAKEKGCTDLTTITEASSIASSIHQHTLNTKSKCTQYIHLRNTFPAYCKECFNCNGIGHFTALCRKACQQSPDLPGTVEQYPILTQGARDQPADAGKADQEAEGDICHGSRRSPSRDHAHTQKSPNHAQGNSSTPYRYQQDSLNISSNHIYFDSITTSLPKEGCLITDTATDGHTTYFNMLQLITKQGIKVPKVKIDSRAQANTIPLSCYRKLFPNKVTKVGNHKQGSLEPTD